MLIMKNSQRPHFTAKVIEPVCPTIQVRERIAELEYLWQPRVAQEQVERKQAQEPGSNLSPFMMHKLRREMRTQDLHLAEASRTSAGLSHNTGTVTEPREFWKVVSRIDNG
jgi:hypothetical protein